MSAEKPASLFREEALKHAASSEELDDLVRVVSGKAWISLLVLMLIFITAIVWGFFGRIPIQVYGQGILMPQPNHIHPINAPSGVSTIVAINVRPGDQVRSGDVIAHIRKLSTTQNKAVISTIRSSVNGRVINVNSAVGERVSGGTSLVTVVSAGDIMDALIFMPYEAGKYVKNNMSVAIAPSNVKKEEFGSIQGKVSFVSHFPSTQKSLMALLHHPALVRRFLQAGSPLMMRARLLRSADTVSGLQWSSSKGPNTTITPGTLVKVTIILRQEAPVSFIIPMFKKILR